MGYLKLNGDLDHREDFWDTHPQYQLYDPFSKLFKNVKDRKLSSDMMWAIVYMLYPDEDENIFYKTDESTRKTMLQETLLPEEHWDNEFFVECYDMFPYESMTAVERALAEEKKALRKRAHLIKDTELTLDSTQIINNKTIVVKGTASQINTLQKDALKVYENYEKIEIKFNKEKAKTVKKGGGKIFKSQNQRMWSDG
jgi:hypothetical protein